MPGETGADYEQVATAEEMEEEVVPDLPTIDNDDQLDEVSGDLTSELAWLTSIPDNGTKTVRLPADTCSLYAALVVLALAGSRSAGSRSAGSHTAVFYCAVSHCDVSHCAVSRDADSRCADSRCADSRHVACRSH